MALSPERGEGEEPQAGEEIEEEEDGFPDNGLPDNCAFSTYPFVDRLNETFVFDVEDFKEIPHEYKLWIDASWPLLEEELSYSEKYFVLSNMAIAGRGHFHRLLITAYFAILAAHREQMHANREE